MRHPNVIERLIRVNFAIDRFGRLPQLYTGLVYYYEVTFFRIHWLGQIAHKRCLKDFLHKGVFFFLSELSGVLPPFRRQKLTINRQFRCFTSYYILVE